MYWSTFEQGRDAFKDCVGFVLSGQECCERVVRCRSRRRLVLRGLGRLGRVRLRRRQRGRRRGLCVAGDRRWKKGRKAGYPQWVGGERERWRLSPILPRSLSPPTHCAGTPPCSPAPLLAPAARPARLRRAPQARRLPLTASRSASRSLLASGPPARWRAHSSRPGQPGRRSCRSGCRQFRVPSP